MSFVKKIYLLCLGLGLQNLLIYTSEKPLIKALLRNEPALAEQILTSNTPPTQLEKDEALVYASGCLSIITESHNGRGIPQTSMVHVLLEHGANPNYISKNICNMTPLQLASAKGRLKTVIVLLQHDADIHMINSEGDNALSHAVDAVEGKHSLIVTELLRRGATPTEQQQSAPQTKLTNKQLIPAYQRLHTFYEPLQDDYDLAQVLAHLILTFDGTNRLLPGYQRLTDTEKENW